jgi:signal transduction histidine kinase
MNKYLTLFLLCVLTFPALQAQNRRNSYAVKVFQLNAGIKKAQINKNVVQEALYLKQLAYLHWGNRVYQDAIKTFEGQLQAETRLGRTDGMMEVHKNLGAIYRSIGRDRQALLEWRTYSAMLQRTNRKKEIYDAFTSLSTLQWKMKRYKDAVADMERALYLAQLMKDDNLLSTCYITLSEYHKAMGNSELAVNYFQNYAKLHSQDQQDQIREAVKDNRNQARQLKDTKEELQESQKVLQEAERIRKEQQMNITLLEKDKALKDMKIKEEETALTHQKNINLFVVVVAVLMAGMAFWVFRDYRKIHHLNEQLGTQNQEIREGKQEIEAQNDRLEASQKLLLDAKVVIQEQNLKLQAYNRNLEKQVEERTFALQKAFNELLLINNDLDTLTYRASHDLKSPVASLDGLVNVALMEIKPEDPSAFYFNQIKSIAGNMASLLDSLSRLRDIKHTNLKPEEFKVREMVEKIIEHDSRMLPQSAKIKFSVEVNPATQLKTDPDLFRLILKNVLQNAVQFSLPAGENHQPHVRVMAHEHTDRMELQVIDNGEGIPKEIAAKIFNMFYRGSVRSKGAGLGLYMCRAAIEKLGGTLEHGENEKGETVFYIAILQTPEVKVMPQEFLLVNDHGVFSVG